MSETNLLTCGECPAFSKLSEREKRYTQADGACELMPTAMMPEYADYRDATFLCEFALKLLRQVYDARIARGETA